MQTDFLVIGSGISGLFFALNAAKKGNVTIITKNEIYESNTNYAQGGCASVFGKDDNTNQHVEDTLRAADGLGNRQRIQILASESPHLLLNLQSMGVPFNQHKGSFHLTREAVHSRARIIHASDITGEEIERVLVQKVKSINKIKILDHHFAKDLLTDKGTCVGATLIDKKKKKIFKIYSGNIILATGGIGRIYSKTTNPKIATGDGIAMAYMAGATVEDMEFVQFHPTMLYGSNPPFLISETLRGEGGLLINHKKKTFMKLYHRDGDLAPRDVVSKFSTIEMNKEHKENVFLDMTHIDNNYLKKRFPNIHRECLKYGIDMTKKPIPVCPAAHYMCGGIRVDENGFTDIKNLYAIGECSCTEIHGADRLASNSMTEGLVFAKRLSDKIEKKPNPKDDKTTTDIEKYNLIKTGKLKKELQELMWKKVSIIRTSTGLKKAHTQLKDIENKIKNLPISEHTSELKNICTTALLVCIAAISRKESRGTHYILEFPKRDDVKWKKHSFQNKAHSKTFYNT